MRKRHARRIREGLLVGLMEHSELKLEKIRMLSKGNKLTVKACKRAIFSDIVKRSRRYQNG